MKVFKQRELFICKKFVKVWFEKYIDTITHAPTHFLPINTFLFQTLSNKNQKMEFIVLPENYQFKNLETSTSKGKKTFLDRSLTNVYQGKTTELKSKNGCSFFVPKDNSKMVEKAKCVLKLDIENSDTVVLRQDNVHLCGLVVGKIMAVRTRSDVQPGVEVIFKDNHKQIYTMKIDFRFVFEQIGDTSIEDERKLNVDMISQKKKLMDPEAITHFDDNQCVVFFKTDNNFCGFTF